MGCGSQASNQLLERTTELLLDDRPGHVFGEAHGLALQPAQFAAERGRQEVDAQRDHLTGLDPEPAQSLEQLTDAARKAILVTAGHELHQERQPEHEELRADLRRPEP